jgi:catechol 2,3-dioxygenase-like lactoylglutathione lyase family enzyme
MRRTWTIIGVRDVLVSFKWYQSLLGLPETHPVHDDFGQILDSDGTVLLCLHEWGAHEHPPLMSPDRAQPGNGLLVFFRVDDFDTPLQRARTLGTRLEEEPHVNPSTGTAEFSLRDPDGYYVTVSALAPDEQWPQSTVISRQWRGLARANEAPNYLQHLRNETFPSLRRIPGFVDASILSRPLGTGVEFLVVTRWHSMDAITRFAGTDPDAAVVPDRVAAMMIDYDRRVTHFEVIE